MKNLMLSCLESRVENNKSIYARFLLSPFRSGDALTVGTALRRALLSQVEGIAILALDIQGITHEFSTIVGVRETVLELSLNFQRVVLKNQIDLKSLEVGYLQIQGPAIVYANDLRLPQGIECVDPTQYIGTVSQDGVLAVKFLIGRANQNLDLKKNTSLLTAKQVKKAKQLFKNVAFNNNTRKLSSSSASLAHFDNFANEQEKNDTEYIPRLRKLALSRLNAENPSVPVPDTMYSKDSINNSFYNTTKGINRNWNKNKNGDSLHSVHKKGMQNKANRTLLSKFCLQNLIPLDPLYNPVDRVNYTLQTDDLSFQVKERLILEIWTNGSIHPREALHLAAISLVTLFSAFRGLLHVDSPSVYKQTEAKALLEIEKNTNKRSSFLYKRYLDKMSLFASDLSDLSLSLKTYIFLKEKNINRLQDLLKYSSKDIFQLVNNREDIFYDIKRCLSLLGLQLHDVGKEKSK